LTGCPASGYDYTRQSIPTITITTNIQHQTISTITITTNIQHQTISTITIITAIQSAPINIHLHQTPSAASAKPSTINHQPSTIINPNHYQPPTLPHHCRPTLSTLTINHHQPKYQPTTILLHCRHLTQQDTAPKRLTVTGATVHLCAAAFPAFPLPLTKDRRRR
jgi:hypothetical protein